MDCPAASTSAAGLFYLVEQLLREHLLRIVLATPSDFLGRGRWRGTTSRFLSRGCVLGFSHNDFIDRGWFGFGFFFGLSRRRGCLLGASGSENIGRA